jgi:hypothetical protein
MWHMPHVVVIAYVVPDILIISVSSGGGAELEPRRPDIAFPVLAGDRRAATLTPVGGAPGEPG